LAGFGALGYFIKSKIGGMFEEIDEKNGKSKSN